MKAWYPTKRDAPLIDRRIQQQRIKKLGFCRKYRPTIPKKRRDKYTRRVLGKLGKTKGSGDENKREKLRVARYTRSVRSASRVKLYLHGSRSTHGTGASLAILSNPSYFVRDAIVALRELLRRLTLRKREEKSKLRVSSQKNSSR